MGIHAPAARPELTDERHEFGVEEMFFSTTDAKGVIINAYDVFATVVPVGDSYLSVRTRPLRQDLWDLVVDQYTATLEVEKAQREDNSRHRVAELGAQDLGAQVTALGLTGIADLCAQLLVAEVQEHSTQSTLLPERPTPPARWPSCCTSPAPSRARSPA